MSKKLHALAFAGLIITGCTTAMSFASPHHWLADLLANLRVQQMLAIAATVALCLMLRRWKSFGLGVLFFCVHMPAMLQARHASADLKTPADESLTLTTINVLSSNGHHDRVIEELKSISPDVFAVLELNSVLATRLNETMSDLYPHSVLRPSDIDNFGIGLYSKHRLENVDIFVLNTSIESIAATLSDQNIRIIATHPVPPMGSKLFESRNGHLRQLASRVSGFRKSNPSTPMIVMGDLNLTPWSPVFSQFQSQSNLFRASTPWSATPTWHRYPFFAAGLVLDHILVDAELGCVGYRVGSDTGSDHRSVTAELVR